MGLRLKDLVRFFIGFLSIFLLLVSVILGSVFLILILKLISVKLGIILINLFVVLVIFISFSKIILMLIY